LTLRVNQSLAKTAASVNYPSARPPRLIQIVAPFSSRLSRDSAAQIAKKHWRQFLPGTSLLDHDQKREFAFGWLNWFGAEIIAVAAALLHLIRVPFGAFKIVAIPDPLLTLPIFSAFLVSLVHFACLYWLRRRCSLLADAERNGGVHVRSVDGSECSLSSRAASEQNYFHRTRKGTGAIVRTLIMAMPEAVLGALLVAVSIIVYATNFYRVLEADLFATILLIQSLPSCRPWHWCGWSASAKVDREK